MRKNFFQKRFVAFLIIFSTLQPANAGLFGYLFGPHGDKRNQLSYRNWSDQYSDGYCLGMSAIESKFDKNNRKQQFNSSAPKDSPYVIESKMRALLNGNPVTFNGYSDLNTMSSENEGLFKKLTRELHLTQYNGNPNSWAKQFGNSSEGDHLLQKLNSQHPDKISIYDPIKKAWHTLKATGYSDKGSYYDVKVNDPNKFGSFSLRIGKDKSGHMSNSGFYSGWGSNVKITDAGAVTGEHIGLKNKFTQNSASYSDARPHH